MAFVKKLDVVNVRSHEVFSLTLSSDVTIITGSNGSGKTSLLEAIYLSLRGTSFKGSDGDVLKKGSPWWRIEVHLDDLQSRVIKFDPTKATSRKQFLIDGKTSARIPVKQKYPVVLFEPEDLRLLHGSPSRRRQFIDTFITQLNPAYGVTIRKYDRTLKQRNNLLKNAYISDDELFSWNVMLADQGAYIIEQRILFIKQINQSLTSLYREVAGTNDDVSIYYSHDYVDNIKQRLLNELHTNLQKDKYLGNTSIGPHRHDVVFEINDSPALSTASRGEARTIVLALKFLEVEIIEEITGKQPIVLLDDVFSELDAKRQKLLASHLKGKQIVITSATSHAGDDLYHIEIN